MRLLLLVTLVVGAVTAQQKWQSGRATYYGGTEALAKAYDPSRGEGSFGILAFGACGYTNVPNGSLPFPKETYAAASDFPGSKLYPGSCGRCYEVRCRSGLLKNNQGKPIKLVYQLTTLPNGTNTTAAFFDGDYARPYLPSINANVQDTRGRRYPGNPAERQKEAFTTCYNEFKTLRIRIADTCPCKQVLSDTAPGVRPGGEVRRQEWCCGPIQHFDVSYWAFEQLAHPVSGAMMLQYRPVNCDTGAPVADNLISPIIYNSNTSSGIQPGWSWFPYNWTEGTLLVPETAPGGGVSSCVGLTPGGGLSFQSRQASKAGYQPFKGRTRLDFLIKFGDTTPDTLPPTLKVFVMETEGSKYCFNEVYLNATAPVGQRGPWQVYEVPLSAFKCEGALNPNTLDRLDFQNVGTGNVQFCLTDLRLV